MITVFSCRATIQQNDKRKHHQNDGLVSDVQTEQARTTQLPLCLGEHFALNHIPGNAEFHQELKILVTRKHISCSSKQFRYSSRFQITFYLYLSNSKLYDTVVPRCYAVFSWVWAAIQTLDQQRLHDSSR